MPAILLRVRQSSTHPANVITVLNLKGGVGKTHTSWLLASVCQERGLRALLIDTDPQGNLSGSFLGDRASHAGVEALFDPASEGNALSLVRKTTFSNVSLIPSSALLARFDESNQTTWEKADLHLSLIDAMTALRPHFDLIVIDCPPRLSLVSFAALCAADSVIIPMEAADWGAQGITQVALAIHYVQQRFNSRLKLLGYLVSRFKKARAYQRSYLQQLRRHFGPLAFDTVIPDLAQFEKAVTDRVPITLHAPRSTAAGIAREFFDEVERRGKGNGGISTSGGRSGLHADAIAAAG